MSSRSSAWYTWFFPSVLTITPWGCLDRKIVTVPKTPRTPRTTVWLCGFESESSKYSSQTLQPSNEFITTKCRGMLQIQGGHLSLALATNHNGYMLLSRLCFWTSISWNQQSETIQACAFPRIILWTTVETGCWTKWALHDSAGLFLGSYSVLIWPAVDPYGPSSPLQCLNCSTIQH